MIKGQKESKKDPHFEPYQTILWERQKGKGSTKKNSVMGPRSKDFVL